MATQVWSDTDPASGESLGLGDDRMRDDRKGVRERLNRGGHYMADGSYSVSGADDDTEGLHVVDEGYGGPSIYKSKASWADPLVPELLVEYSDTGADFAGASAGITNCVNVTSGDDPGHRHTGIIHCSLAGLVTTGQILYVFRAPRTLTFVDCYTTLFATCATGNVRIQIYKLIAPSNTTNRQVLATANKLFDPITNAPSIAAGDFAPVTAASTFAIATMAAGDELQFEVDGGSPFTGTPSGLNIYLRVR